MRIIPRKIKVRNNVWKCYSMKDIILALIMFAIIFVCITANVWWLAIVVGLISLVMLMPTGDGIFYSYIAENVRFLFSRTKVDKNSKKEKEKKWLYFWLLFSFLTMFAPLLNRIKYYSIVKVVICYFFMIFDNKG